MSAEEAIKKFDEFLIGLGRSTCVYWLFKEDCLITNTDIYMTFSPTINALEEFIYPIHNSAMHKGFGIDYRCIGEFNGLSLCFPSVPEDEIEMSQCMIPKEGKYTALLHPMNTHFIHKRWKFNLRTMFKKESHMMAELPSRAEILQLGLTKQSRRTK